MTDRQSKHGNKLRRAVPIEPSWIWLPEGLDLYGAIVVQSRLYFNRDNRMPRRHILSERQRSALFDLPTDELSLLRHYTLGDDDLAHIQERRRPENRLGFTLQLCALRYPGRALAPGEVIPHEVLSFIGAQLGVPADALLIYAARRQTRQEHMEALRKVYGYKTFTGRGARDLRDWLFDQAEEARSNEDLAQRLVARCRETLTILPAVSTIERLCADALVAAERRIETRIAERLDNDAHQRLDRLLTELLDANISRFIWLRQFEVGNNSAAANRLLDRLEFLRALALDPQLLAGVPPHRVARLRRQGERYFTDGLRDNSSDRRWAILAVCAVEWEAAIADTVVETHDRIVGKTWREAKRLHDERVADSKATVTDTLSQAAVMIAEVAQAASAASPALARAFGKGLAPAANPVHRQHRDGGFEGIPFQVEPRRQRGLPRSEQAARGRAGGNL